MSPPAKKANTPTKPASSPSPTSAALTLSPTTEFASAISLPIPLLSQSSFSRLVAAVSNDPTLPCDRKALIDRLTRYLTAASPNQHLNISKSDEAALISKYLAQAAEGSAEKSAEKSVEKPAEKAVAEPVTKQKKKRKNRNQRRRGKAVRDLLANDSDDDDEEDGGVKLKVDDDKDLGGLDHNDTEEGIDGEMLGTEPRKRILGAVRALFNSGSSRR